MLNTLKQKYQIQSRSDAIPVLIRAIAQKIGNRRYLHDLEDLLKKLEPLSPYDNETIWYLVRDIKNL